MSISNKHFLKSYYPLKSYLPIPTKKIAQIVLKQIANVSSSGFVFGTSQHFNIFEQRGDQDKTNEINPMTKMVIP